MSDLKTIETAAKAIKDVTEAVPVYQDTLQPAAKEIGQSLVTIAKTIEVVLAPLSVLVWGYAQIKQYITSTVTEKLKNTPPNEIQTPKPNVAVPTIEALRYTAHEKKLRELYANLLAASMDSMTAPIAYPSFVQIIKQMTPDEAKLMEHFSVKRPWPIICLRIENIRNEGVGFEALRNFTLLGKDSDCEFPDQADAYLDNLCRLGLIEVPQFFEYSNPKVYLPLETHPLIKKYIRQIEKNPQKTWKIVRRGVRVTKLGDCFIKVCVLDHDSIRTGKMS